MAASLTLTRSASARGVSTRGVPGGSDGKEQSLTGSRVTTIAGGKVWRGRCSLAASGTQTYDLTALAQLDDAGDTVETFNFSLIYSIEVQNVSTNPAAVAVVGNAGSNAFFHASGSFGAATHTRAVSPGPPVNLGFYESGMTTSSKNNLLVTAGSGGALVLDLLIVGS